MFIVDTVVLLYFLLTGQEDLLIRLLGSPLRVPFVVYDPDEPDVSEALQVRVDLLSEIRQSIHHYETRSATDELSRKRRDRVRRVDELHRKGLIEPIRLTPRELSLTADLQRRDRATMYKISTPLGPGESACIAIAHCRGWTIATDDNDALTALSEINSGQSFPYTRIRALLIRATNERLITPDKANRIHREMRTAGFWDAGLCLS